MRNRGWKPLLRYDWQDRRGGFQPRIPNFMVRHRIVLTPVTILWDSSGAGFIICSIGERLPAMRRKIKSATFSRYLEIDE